MKQIPFHEFKGHTISEVLKEWRDYLRTQNHNYNYDSDDDWFEDNESEEFE